MFVKVLVGRSLKIVRLFCFNAIGIYLVPKSTLPTDIGSIDEMATDNMDDGLLRNFLDQIKRYGIYAREKFKAMRKNIAKTIQKYRSTFSGQFNNNS